jgi:hypothetical protein
LGEIILMIACFITGVATGYTWRNRISKARRAKERERRMRNRHDRSREGSTSVLRSLENPPA